jgi:acetyl-CoA synthetase/medium-chain acyl-CoA synthetase
VKGLRIGRRRGRAGDTTLSPLELALRPALVDGRWQVPERFNFTRDVVEALARDPKRRALTSLRDGIIEPCTFLEISEGASVWALALRERSVAAGDRVLLMAGSTVDWLEALLGSWKVGAVVVPCLPSTSPQQLERLVSSTDAALVIAERSLESTIERMGFTPDVHLYDPGTKRNSKDVPPDVPTHDTSSRDLAFVVPTTGASGPHKDVAHTHGSVFATRVQAEHWLDVGRGDTVWCAANAASPLTMWNTVIGPWSRGAEVALQHGEFDVDERLDLLYRLGASILCQAPAEYRALAEHPKLERFRSPRLRRLVSTGDYLDPDVIAVFEERWGLSIADGYGQTETNIIVANQADSAVHPGSWGRALPGHHVAVIDDQGNEMPPGVEGDLAVRGRPPTLFAGYWELAEETKSAFLGDWYLTGDVAQVDEDGYFTFVARAEDLITSSGRTFGPYEVERVLDAHAAIAASAVVGIRDLQRGGHFVRAFVVPKRPDGGSEQLEAELREYATQALPVQQVPREIVFVDGLPRVEWKISRHELREHPVVGRPLWEAPTELEEPPPAAAPPRLDGEFSPRIEAPPELPSALVREPELAAPEPESMIAEALPTPAAPEPPALEPVVVEPVPLEPRLPEPEPVVAEALPELEIEVEVEPAPEPPATEALREPESDPELDVEPEPEPAALAVVPLPEPPVFEPESEPDEPPTPELTVVEPDTALPDYVIDRADGALPVVVPEPEPEPDLSGPLPEFVVERSADELEPVARIEPVSTPVDDEEEEEDLGPLPDFVIDPSDPEAARREPPPPPPDPEPSLAPRVTSPEETEPALPTLSFPSASDFAIPRGNRDAAGDRDSRSPRSRQHSSHGTPKAADSEEPGDETQEVGWMQGLSNRLSAYSLSEDESPPEIEDRDDDTG